MLKWWRKWHSQRWAIELPARGIVFVAEQDGIAERELKAKLVRQFAGNRHLESAFLVRVRYGTSRDLKVILCLNTRRGDVSVAKSAASEFKQMFAREESLDIIFLTHEQLQQVSQIARPFYTRSSVMT